MLILALKAKAHQVFKLFALFRKMRGAGYDLIAKGLVKIMPTPKESEAKQ